MLLYVGERSSLGLVVFSEFLEARKLVEVWDARMAIPELKRYSVVQKLKIVRVD